MTHNSATGISPPSHNWWRFRKESLVQPPVQAGDTVYVVGGDSERPEDNNLYAIDITEGTVHWSYEPKQSVTTPPVFSNHNIYVGTATARNRSGKFHAVDSTSGKKQFRIDINETVHSEIVLENEVGYFVSEQNNLHAVDLSQRTKLWDQNLPNGQAKDDAEATQYSLTTDGEIVWVGKQGVPQGLTSRLYALNSENGRIELDFGTSSYAPCKVTAADGTVYAAADNKLYAVDGANRQKKWEFEPSPREERVNALGQSHTPRPIATHKTVYFGTETGMHAIDVSSGTQEWKFPTWQVPVDSMALIGETICVGGYFAVYFVDAATGEARWRLVGETDSIVGTKDAIYTVSSDHNHSDQLLVYPVKDYTSECQSCETSLTEYGDIDFCPECGAELDSGGS